MTPGERGGLRGIDSTRLARYLYGECDERERAAIEQWVAADPSHARTLAALRETLGGVGGRPGDLERMRRGIAERIAKPRTSRYWTASRITRVAAGIAVIIAGSVTAWYSGWVSLGAPQPFREFASPRGSRATITLRDGTQISLAADTRLRVPGDFGRGARMVDLTGEASFAVVHDVRRPFTVRTAHAVIRDVGTRFVVRAYADDSAERVAVEDGEVAIAGLHARTVTRLRRLDVARVADTVVSVTRGSRLETFTAWEQGGLAFEDTPLGDVARDIGRAFDIPVTIEDSNLVNRRVTATFSRQPLDLVLEEVTRVVGARYERTAHGVVIRRAGPRPIRLTRTRE